MFNQSSNRSQIELSDIITPHCVCLMYQWTKWVRSIVFKLSCTGYILLSQKCSRAMTRCNFMNGDINYSEVVFLMGEFCNYQFMGFKNTGNWMRCLAKPHEERGSLMELTVVWPLEKKIWSNFQGVLWIENCAVMGHWVLCFFHHWL